ncbi:MAG: hypothetical protein JF615_15415, partial [Asticcacaulis sp.]|nr:hypothetical protein [Asticcacaulis sp.]
MVSVRSICASILIAALASGPVHAGTPLTEDQAKRLNDYMRQASKPVVKSDGSATATVVTPVASDVAGNSERPVVAGHDIDPTINAYLALSAPPSAPTGLTYGIAAGLGVQPAVPELTKWDTEAAQAIVTALNTPNKDVTADQAALFAADPVADPAFEERVNLMRELFRVDGTEDLIRFFVAREHMKLIVQEVARHIDFNKLSQTDKVRLASIVTVVQTELQDNIILLNARQQA